MLYSNIPNRKKKRSIEISSNHNGFSIISREFNTNWMREAMNVLYLPKIWKPFDQLSRVVFVEFDVWEVHLEHGRAWISHPEEHQFRFAQMHRCQCWRVHGSQGKHLLFSNKLFDFFGFVIFISFSKVVFFWYFVVVIFVFG